MRMAIADRKEIKLRWLHRIKATGQFVTAGLLLCIACFLPVLGQSRARLKPIELSRVELDNGNYSTAIELAQSVIYQASPNQAVISAFEMILTAQIAQQKHVEARKTLEQYMGLVATNSDHRLKAHAYLRAADLYRSERRFPEAMRESKSAWKTAPNDPDILAGYYLSLGRILFTSGYDLSAIIWLEKAEKLFELKSVSSGQLDTYRFLSLAWSSKMNYPAALKYSEKLIAASQTSRFKFRYRHSLFEGATLLSSIGQNRKALELRETGLRQSLAHDNKYQARNFLAALLLNALFDGNLSGASVYLDQLTSIDVDGSFAFNIELGRAIIFGLTGRRELSDQIFSGLEKKKITSAFILPSWKVTIAEKNKEWERVIHHNRTLLDLTLAQNFREDLPGIFLSLAGAHYHLRQPERSTEYLDKCLSMIEAIRTTDNKNLSLGLLEIYHKAYRLLTQMKLEHPSEAFEISDYLKARLLRDKINNSPTIASWVIDQGTRRKLEILSPDIAGKPGADSEISTIESTFTTHVPETVIPKPDFSELEKLPELENKAVVSYFFTTDGRLLAFVWEKGKPIRSVFIAGSEVDTVAEVRRIEQKIRTRLFFKRDGKDLYDKLLKPLNISATHLIIVPDKQLWKIPFQALSPDGEKYLIEYKLVSYAPSVAILIEQLKYPKSARFTIQAFANSAYNGQSLRYVNDESTRVSALYNSRPVLNATIPDFKRLANKSDIMHFSMHAQVNNDQPLDSYLWFKEVGKDGGQLTVKDLLKSKLRKGSLVFLASCDTNNVLSSEGLVSLAWGMMGAGATAVISAQWEANDRSTLEFTGHFYRKYRSGMSPAEAMQTASLAMIANKDGGFHEPYYWAAFMLNGDFR